jgi:hypothetical protein
LACCALESASAGEVQKRLTPDEIAALPFLEAGTGTSGVAGIRTTVLSGDPNKSQSRSKMRLGRRPIRS